MKCEQVRELLPELAEPGPRPAGPVEQHLARCAECSARLGAYRALVTDLSALQTIDLEPPPGSLERTIRTVRVAALADRLPSLTDVRRVSVRAARTLRTPAAAAALASVGGVAVGAAAIGLMWWRLARRDAMPALRQVALPGGTRAAVVSS